MAKKIQTIPFGGEIPPDLADACNSLQSQRGWVKKRMLAAAMRAFVLASEKDQNDWYFDAYRSLPKAVIGEDEKNEADRPDHGSFGQALDKAHSKLEKAAAARTRKPAKDR